MAEIAEGPKVDKPNGKPAKSWRTKGVPDAVQAFKQTMDAFKELSFDDIRRRIEQAWSPLSAKEIKDAAQQVGVILLSSGKGGMINDVVNRITQRKTSWESGPQRKRLARPDVSPTFYDECKDLARQVLKDMEIDR